MIKVLLISALGLCMLPATADDKEAAGKNPDATKFIRVERDDKQVQLQTSITTYTKDGVAVDLIGAIHIADAAYYTQLNKEFKNYQALLFEMIGGGDMKQNKEAENHKKPKDPVMAMLGNIHGMAGKLMDLQGQKEGIDYKAKNFVHADLSLAKFEKLQEQQGESILGFAIENAQNAQPGAKQPDIQKLLTAVISGNANAIKLQLVDTLGQADQQIAAMKGQSVIIGERNKACLKVLDTQIKTGKNKLGIFYGAAHFPDMEKTMLKMGYTKTAQRWLSAWHIPKAAKPQKQNKKQPDALPDAA